MPKQLSLKAADGHAIPALLYRRQSRRLLIVTHGITSEKTEDGLYDQLIAALPKSYDVILFDFRGHGASLFPPKKATVCGEVLDLMTVLNWAGDQDYELIDHLATSFGASIAILAVGAYGPHLFGRTVFWNPVTNYRSTFFSPATPWTKEFFDQQDIRELSWRKHTRVPETRFRISPIMTQELLLLHPETISWPSSSPLLIVHGDRDTVVSVADSRAYAKANKARLEVLRGVDHGFDHLVNRAIAVSVDWLAK